MMDELIGKEIGQYRIEEIIGQGGMATIYRAYQFSLERHVALKVLPPSFAAKNPVFIKRFQREAKSIARLHHPNILPVYDFGIERDYSYIVMRYVEDVQTFSDIIARSTDLTQCLDLIGQVASALSYAHREGVIHRDVKPSNILLDQNHWALLSDFGLAKVEEAVSRLTESGRGIGTAAYMSPEQAQGRQTVDHRTDIFALGVIVYEILTGTLPHDAPTSLGILLKRTTEPPLPPRKLNPSISQDVEQVILRALATNPQHRFERATEFADALKHSMADGNVRPVSSAVDQGARATGVVVNTHDFAPPDSDTTKEGAKAWQSPLWLAVLGVSLAVIPLLIWGGSAFGSTVLNNDKEAETTPVALMTPTPSETATSTPSPSPTHTAVPPTPTRTPSPTATASPTQSPPTRTATVTSTPTPAPPTATPTPVLTPTPTLPDTVPTLLAPLSLDEPSFGPTVFEWQWPGDIPPDLGFEVRVWREGEPPAGVHNAVEDNLNGRIEQIGADRYRLNADIRDTPGVQGRTGEYFWTVVLVQISPDYVDLGRQAAPALLRFEAGGSGGSDDNGGGGGSNSGDGSGGIS